MTRNSTKGIREYIIGADIGGTFCKLGLFNGEGELFDKWKIPTARNDEGDVRDAERNMKVFDDLAESIEKQLTQHNICKNEIIGMGVGVPGPVNLEGVIDNCPALGWKNLNIPKILQKKIGIKISCGNDANLAALGESWRGFDRAYNDAIFITLGTVVGGGIICNGKIHRGAHGCGGEIGHIKVNPHETEIDGCGGRGCLQQYASATGIIRLAEKLGQGREKITAKDIFQRAKAGDKLAIEVIEQFGEILGRTLAGICLVFDPEVVIIGGGISAAGEALVDVVRKHYRNWAYPPTKDMEFKLASLGNDAGIYGCAKLVLEQKGD